LKGDLKKRCSHLQYHFRQLLKIIGEDNTAAMLNEGLIEVLPLAYIRGRSR
jgi:phosphate starvation-inducible protein PhoH